LLHRSDQQPDENGRRVHDEIDESRSPSGDELSQLQPSGQEHENRRLLEDRRDAVALAFTSASEMNNRLATEHKSKERECRRLQQVTVEQ